MHLKYNFETIKLDDRVVAVPVGDAADDFHAIMKLNETAAFIFDLLRNDITEEEIVAALLKEYNGTGEQLAIDTHNYLMDFREKGLLA